MLALKKFIPCYAAALCIKTHAALLAAWIESNILLQLASAPFDKQDETLVPEAGSCANCPKRTGFNKLLFPDVRKDSCKLCGICFWGSRSCAQRTSHQRSLEVLRSRTRRHGYCTYDFFDQCPHWMACAKCSFYLPKHSSQAQLLEGKTNLLHLRQEIPLSDAEVAAVDEGIAAMESLLGKLVNVPTPAGPTPLEIRASTGTDAERSEPACLVTNQMASDEKN